MGSLIVIIDNSSLKGLCYKFIHDQVGSFADSSSTTQIEREEDYANYSKSSGATHADDGSRVFQTTENSPTQAKLRATEGDASLSLGIVYDSRGEFTKAIECYEKSLNIARKAGDRAREGTAYFNLGTAYCSLCDFPQAIDCYKKSLNIAR